MNKKGQNKLPSRGKDRAVATVDLEGVGEGELRRAYLSQRVLRILTGQWLKDLGPGASRYLPTLLIGVYAAWQEGRRLSKRDACALMMVDAATTGPKYIQIAEDAGLIEVERGSKEDRRKVLLAPSEKLKALLHEELHYLAVPPDASERDR